MDAKELAKFIGRKAIYPFRIGRNNIDVEMVITDARSIFDRDEVKVMPVAGSGSGWANVNNIKIHVANSVTTQRAAK